MTRHPTPASACAQASPPTLRRRASGPCPAAVLRPIPRKQQRACRQSPPPKAHTSPVPRAWPPAPAAGKRAIPAPATLGQRPHTRPQRPLGRRHRFARISGSWVWAVGAVDNGGCRGARGGAAAIAEGRGWCARVSVRVWAAKFGTRGGRRAGGGRLPGRPVPATSLRGTTGTDISLSLSLPWSTLLFLCLVCSLGCTTISSARLAGIDVIYLSIFLGYLIGLDTFRRPESALGGWKGAIYIERERDYTYPALRLIQVLPGHPLADSKDETVSSLQ